MPRGIVGRGSIAARDCRAYLHRSQAGRFHGDIVSVSPQCFVAGRRTAWSRSGVCWRNRRTSASCSEPISVAPRFTRLGSGPSLDEPVRDSATRRKKTWKGARGAGFAPPSPPSRLFDVSACACGKPCPRGCYHGDNCASDVRSRHAALASPSAFPCVS